MMRRELVFSSYVVKVASRCNLNCDYCYMYQHVDQTWKNKPRFLSVPHQKLFAERLKEYVGEKKLNRILVVFHGGEPLLFGPERLVAFAQAIRSTLAPLGCQADFGIQTNGVLLKEEHLKMFEAEKISVSLSIDGPKEIHNAHRVDHKGKPSFDKVFNALKLMQNYPSIFQGCIAVINPHFKPRQLFEFFYENKVEGFNILLPDANYLAPPEGRLSQPNLYKNWLIEAFDCWFDEFSKMKCDYFDWIIKAILGNASQTDYFGLGDISLLVLETDGTYHNHDVLKITEESGSELGLSLENAPIQAAEKSEKIAFHRHLLTKEGLSQKCQTCKHVDVCGGGFIGHRFGSNGYKNPSIYCEEIYALIDHITNRIENELQKKNSKQPAALSHFSDREMQLFFSSKTSEELIAKLKDHSARKIYGKFKAVIPYARSKYPQHLEAIDACDFLHYEQLKPALLEPATAAWLRAFYAQSIESPATNIVDEILPADPEFFQKILELISKAPRSELSIQSKEKWFQLGLGDHIVLNHPEPSYSLGLENLKKGLALIHGYDPKMIDEMREVSPHIQMIKDKNASPEKDVSLSDVTIPGAIFIGVWIGEGLLSPYLVAASLIHEHLHQKLYLLQNRFELFLPQDTSIFSPWPNKMRPPNGALHAVYVFTHVADFWREMIAQEKEIDLARAQLERELPRLEQCIGDISKDVKFTSTGQRFFDCVLKKYEDVVRLSQLISV